MTRLTSINPIAIREMRARMRGPRAFIILAGYLLLLGLLIFLVYVRSGGGSSYSYPQTSPAPTGNNLGPTVSFQIGQNIFLGIFLFLLLVVAVVTPAITAGAVSREIEGRTHDLLLLTPAYGRILAFGKLFAALAFVFFLLMGAFPFVCIVFVFGGVNLGQLLTGMALLMLTAFAFAVLGLFFSALFHRTALALIFSYGVILALTFGTLLVSSSLVALINQDQKITPPIGLRYNANLDPAFDVPRRALLVNPLAAIGSVLALNAPYHGAVGEDLQLFPNSALFGGNVTRYYAPPNFARGQGGAAGNAAVLQTSKPPLWAGYALTYVIGIVVFLLLTLFVMRPRVRPLKKARVRKNRPKDKSTKPAITTP